MMLRVRRGQSVLEYAIVLALVSAACIAMSLYVRRAVQGKLFKIEERVTAKVERGEITPN